MYTIHVIDNIFHFEQLNLVRNKTFVEKTGEQLKSEHDVLKEIAKKRYNPKKIKMIQLKETINVSESGLWAINFFNNIIEGSEGDSILYNKKNAIERLNVILNTDTLLT